MFKNAGTTFDYFLAKKFGSSLAYKEASTKDPARLLSPSALARFVQSQPNLSAVSSHQARLPTPQIEGVTFHPVIFLRHPIDRIGSVYAHHARALEHEGSLDSASFREKGLQAFLACEDNHPITRNFQVRALAGYGRKSWSDPITRHDLSIAKTRVKEIQTVGLVERFEESLLLFNNILTPVFGSFETSYIKQNQNLERKSSFEERVQEIHAHLGDKLFALENESNVLDVELYQFALEMLERRTKASVDI